MNRINVTLDDEHAERLWALAERTHVQEGTLARSLLSSALDASDPEPQNIAALLDGIPGRTRPGARRIWPKLTRGRACR